MNLLHMKYALAVAQTNSINKAADELFVGAPALSRAIKELETSLGVTLFERSAKGMSLTPDGELFIRYAQKALKQIDDIEAIFRDGTTSKEHFSISVPRASYIADAFAEFSRRVELSKDAELFYKETDSNRVISDITKEDYKLGILRFSEQHVAYYKSMLKEKGMSGELITEFTYVLIMNRESLLSQLSSVSFNDLNGYTEIAHADHYGSSFPMSELKKDVPEHGGCRIFVFERASQLEMLSKNPGTYMWSSPIPEKLLDRYGLTQVDCEDSSQKYRDVLIHREDYRLSSLDNMFIEELIKSKRMTFRNM